MNPAAKMTTSKVAFAVFMPGAKMLKVDAHDWNSDPYSPGACTAFRWGQITRFGAGLRRPEGRLAFATADMAIGWAGYIDGAIESGSRAAERTRSQRGARAAPPGRGSLPAAVVQLRGKEKRAFMPGRVRALQEMAGWVPGFAALAGGRGSEGV